MANATLTYTTAGGTEVTVSGYNTATGTDVVIPAVDGSGNTVVGIDASIFAGDTTLTLLNMIDATNLKTIGANAFDGCTSIVGDLYIPASVTDIQDSAFAACAFNGTLTFGSGVTTIGPSAFAGCNDLQKTGLNLSNVTSIGASAFAYCAGLAGSLTLGSGLTTIESSTFTQCGFTSVTISTSVTEIKDHAFAGCTSISGTLTIPANVTSIRANAFDGCTGLQAPGDITVRLECLTSITIEDAAFANLGTKGALLFLSGVPPTIPPLANPFSSTTFSDLSLGYGDTAIATGWYDVFSSFSGMLFISSTVTSIAQKAFSNGQGGPGCSFSGDLDIPSSVKTIGDYAFTYCTGFTSLTLHSGLETIGENAFNYCIGLTGDIIIPNSVTTIGTGAFSRMTNIGLGSLTLPTNVLFTAIPDGMCDHSKFTGPWPTIPTNVTSIGAYAFSNCTSFTGNNSDCVIPDSVTSIGTYAFDGSLFREVTIGSGVSGNGTSIGTSAFEGAIMYVLRFNSGVAPQTIGLNAFPTEGPGGYPYGLIIGATSTGTVSGWNIYTWSNVVLYFGAGITSIESQAFTSQTGLVASPGNEGLTIPNSVLTIGEGAFNGCSNINGPLILPAGLVTIESNVFNGCSKLTTFALPTSVTEIRDSAFKGCTTLGPDAMAGVFTIPESVTRVETSAFEDVLGYMYLVVGSNVSYIGNNAFKRWIHTPVEQPAWVDITFNSGVAPATIGTDAFIMSQYNTLTVGATSIGAVGGWYTAFSGWTGSLVIGPAVTSIDINAFSGGIGSGSGCSFTGALEIPATVETIGDYAFYYCAGLRTLTIQSGVKTIGASAFEGIGYFTGDLTIPNSVTSIGGNSFNNLGSQVNDGCGALSLGSGLTSIPPGAFYFAGFTGTLTISSGITSIGDYAFDHCSKLVGPLIIIGPVTSIGTSTFSHCTNLGSAYGMYPQTPIDIPNTVETIGANAFENCTSFSGIIIGNGVTQIGDSAFSGIVTDISFNKGLPPSISIGSSAFHLSDGLNKGLYTLTVGYTSSGEVGGWGSSYFTFWKGKLALGPAVTSIAADAFYDSNNYIGMVLEYNDQASRSFTIPNTVTSIGNNAFRGVFHHDDLVPPNTPILLLTLGTGITSVGSNAFFDCHVETLTLPQSLTSGLSGSAFNDFHIYGGIVLTENITQPSASNVLTGVSYGTNNASTGTFNEATRNIDPTPSKVKAGTSYKIGNVSKIGTMVAGGEIIHGF